MGLIRVDTYPQSGMKVQQPTAKSRMGAFTKFDVAHFHNKGKYSIEAIERRMVALQRSDVGVRLLLFLCERSNQMLLPRRC